MAPPTSKVESQVSKEGLTDDARIPNPPLVHITSPWLDSVTARIRARPIPWEGYARADLVSQDELKMIRSIDGNTDTEAAKVLDSRGQEYALLYLRLLSKLSRTDTLQQVLVLVGDMLQDRDDRLQLFLDAAEQLQSAESVPDVTTPPQSDMERWPWAPLVRLLSVNDDFAQLKAAQFITLLLVAPRTSRSATLTRNASTRVLDDLVSFLAKLINTKSTGSHDEYAEGNGADIALQVLESLLRVQRSRRFVWDRDVSAQSQKDSDKSQAVIPGLLSILQNALVGGNGAREQERKRERRGDGSSSNNSNNNNSAGPSGSNTPSTSASGSSSSSTSPSSYQTQYQVIFCLWLLSFDSYIAANLHRKFNAIPLLVDLARTAVKEKVIRVIVATLRNLLSVGGTSTDNATAMLGSKLLPLVQTLQDRKWSDEDLPEDLEYLQETLQERLKGMTTFEEYLSELSSGKLSFDNPAHDLDDFWRANAGKLLDQSESKGAYPGDQDGEEEDKTKKESNGDDGDESPQDRVAARTGLNRLLDLLSTSQDATTLSVAIHDVGKLIQFTDTARRKINDAPNGGKLQVMQLMNHEDAEVKYRALSTVGKLMSASWR